MNKTIFLFILGIIFLLVHYYLKIIKSGKFKIKKTLIGKITYKFIPKKNSKQYIELEDTLKKAYLNIDIADAYTIKTSILIGTILLSIAIFFTNVSYKKQKIFNSVIYSDYAITSVYNDPALRKKNVNIVSKYLNCFLLDEKNSIKNKKQIKQILNKNISVNIDDLDTITNVTYKDLINIKKLYSFKNIILYLFLGLSGILIFNIGLKFLTQIRANLIQQEIIDLTNLITIIATSQNIKVITIINSLTSNAKYLKPTLEKFSMAYMINRKEAYDLYISNTRQKNFERLIGLLRQMENSNKDEAINSIKIQNNNLRDMKKIEFENEMQRKEGIAMVLFAIGAIFFLKMVLDYTLNALKLVQTLN